MKRVVGTILFGLGVLFVVLAVGLPLYVAPAATKLPYDLAKSTSLVEAKNATFLQIRTGGVPSINKGDLLSTTTVVPQPIITQENQKTFNDNAVVWDVYSSTRRVDNNEAISESTTHIALDRVSGVPVNWNEAWVNDGTETKTKFAGQIYKFPFHTERRDYKFWDGELGADAPLAKFEAVETIGGLEVYRFKQTIPWVKTATDETSRKVLLANFAKTATTGDVWYTNTRTLWVEPVTGQFLNVREQRQQEFRDDLGGKTTLLDADFQYTKATKDSSVKTAGENKGLLQMVGVYAPIGLGALGFVLIVVGMLMHRRRRDEGFEARHQV